MVGETVTRIRTADSTGDDPYGNPLPGADVETTLTGAAFDPGGSLEPVEVGRAQTVTTPRLYFIVPPDIISTDRIRARGIVYNVIGNPALWINPFTGVTAGLVVELKAVEG